MLELQKTPFCMLHCKYILWKSVCFQFDSRYKREACIRLSTWQSTPWTGCKSQGTLWDNYGQFRNANSPNPRFFLSVEGTWSIWRKSTWPQKDSKSSGGISGGYVSLFLWSPCTRSWMWLLDSKYNRTSLQEPYSESDFNLYN